MAASAQRPTRAPVRRNGRRLTAASLFAIKDSSELIRIHKAMHSQNGVNPSGCNLSLVTTRSGVTLLMNLNAISCREK
jgi:hypothetical protein